MAKKIKEYYASVESDEQGTYLSIPIMSKGKSYEILIDTVDYERFKQYNWNVLYSKGEATKYIRRKILKGEDRAGGVELLHHFILRLGSEIHLDHIDGNGFNNRSYNIRVATSAQNSQNRRKRKNTSSKFKGVIWCKRDKKWIARITYQGKQIRIGSFESEITNGVDEGEIRAAEGYDEAAVRYFGSFALLNFEEDRNTVAIKSGLYRTVHLMNDEETRNIEAKILKLKDLPTWEIREAIADRCVEEILDYCHYYCCGVNQVVGEIKQGLLRKTVKV